MCSSSWVEYLLAILKDVPAKAYVRFPACVHIDAQYGTLSTVVQYEVAAPLCRVILSPISSSAAVS